MKADKSAWTDALLSMQRALWDMVTPPLRGVAVRVDDDFVRGRMIYEREPTEDEREIVSEVGTLMVADYGPDVDVDVVADAAPPLEPLGLLVGERWVYLRREPEKAHIVPGRPR